MQFNYGTNVPQSSINQYVAGTLVSNSELLSSIEILIGSTVVKDYFLTYQASPLTGRKQLIQLMECADSAGANCLSPTTVGYQTGNSGLSTTANSALSSSGGLLSTRYDLNGDGYPDLIYAGTGGIYVAFGSASGYGTPFNSNLPGCTLIGRVEGGAQDGILAINNGVWWFYSWNGSTFAGTSTGLAYDSTAIQYQLADVDGDGRPDLVSMKITGPNGAGKFTATLYTRLNTSSGGTPSFSGTLNTAATLNGLAAAQLLTPDFQYSKLRRYDFNGDGRDDLVLQTTTGVNPNYMVNTIELISTGTTFTKSLIQSVGAGANPSVLLTNWNDDKCTDLVSLGTLYVSGCNGTVPASYYIGTVLAAVDYDGDGRTDLLVANGSNLGVYLSKGSGAPTLSSTSVPYVSSCQYVWMDANGDGLDDLGCWSQTGAGALTYYLHNGSSDLATSFADGYGVSYSPTYVPLSDAGSIYTKGTSAVFPYQDYSGPLYVVSAYAGSDGIGATFTSAYGYSGAIVNLQGRGFEGFTTISETDSRTGFQGVRTYSTIFPNAGMLTAESLRQGTGTNVSGVTYAVGSLTLDATANNQRFFPYTSSSNTNTYEVQVGGSYNGQLITTTAVTYGTPDIYGNFSSVETTITDEDSGSPYFGQQWTSTTATTYSSSPSTWCNSLPTEKDVTNTAPSVPAITRHMSFTPDFSMCRETQQVVEPGNAAYQVTTGFGFDAFGNINSQSMTGVNMPVRTTSINWGATGQYPATVTNALSQITHTNFDPNSGKLLSIQDPNGITTSWLYDPFQRIQQETRPDGTKTTWAYNNCATAGCVNANNKTTLVRTNLNVGGTTLNTQNTYLDSFDRTLVTSKQMLNGAYDRNETQYDNMGNVHQSAAPCTFVSCVAYWTTNTYDQLNRLLSTARPISATNGTLQTTTMKYSGRTTTMTDPQSKVTTTVAKVSGKVGRTTDHNGYYVSFNQDAFGSLLSVTDGLSNTLRTMTYGYGLKAYRTSLVDMDLGSRTYTPDALGEVTSYSDGKGQSFSATFDALSRMTSRTEPDLTTTWTWGSTAASFNIGKLASVSSVATAGTHTDSYTYDNAGRLTVHTIVNPTDGSRVFDYAYDTTTGLLKSLFYPFSYPSTSRVEVGYNYQNGILQQIVDLATSTVWWQANSTNTWGQITQETAQAFSTNPQIVTTRTYDAVTGWLGSIQAGVGGGGGSTLQNQAYLYDEMGNVTERQDNNQGLTENFYYDNLYRLDHSTLGGTTSLQMGYDAMGNITSKSDVAGGATWTYDPVRKHAVTRAGSSAYTYSYDSNGNVSSRNGSITGWTSYNYPSGVTTATESATFDYGPNRQRWRMVYTGPTGNETTYYATPMFEVVHTSSNTDYRHYLFAGGRVVMGVSRSLTGAVQRPFLTDHQGSISALMHYTGSTIGVSESFTAFGNRREASTWTGSPTSSELTAMNGTTREGYTFQTVLGTMGLNHMNGRIEDSVTGRFLSPDPRGTIQGNTQSWNRYSYANNNPLTYTDPTGFDSSDCNGTSCKYQAQNGMSNLTSGMYGSMLSSASFLAANSAVAPQGGGGGDSAPQGDAAATSDGAQQTQGAGTATSAGTQQAQSQNPTQNAAVVPTSNVVADALQEIVVEGSRDAAVGFATTGVFVLGVLFPSNLGDGVVQAEQKPPSKSRQSKPKNAPPGTRPIDQSPNGHEWIEGTKDAVGAGPADWVGVAPNGDIITTNPDGTAENHGPSTEPY